MIEALLVSEREEDYRLVAELLAPGGRFSVTWTGDYLAALMAMGRNAYALYLVSCETGESVALVGEARARGCTMPVIALTRADEGERALEAGATDYLVKGQMNGPLLERVMRYALERHETQQTLARERHLLRTLIDHLPDFIFIKDADGRYVFNNAAGAAQAGLDELVGKTAFDFFPPELAAQYEADDQAVLRSGEPLVNAERQTVDKEGQAHWVLTTKMPVRDPQGQVIGLVGITRDITPSKQAEEALRESEVRFRALFEYSPDGIVLIDPHDPAGEWPIVDCNDAMCRMNGYTKEELIGQTIDILHEGPANPAERAAYYERLRHVAMMKVDVVHKHKDGHLFHIDTATALITLGGRELVLGIDRDISTRKQAEEALRQSERMLAQAQKIAHIGSWAWTVGENRETWSDELYRLYGLEPGEVEASFEHFLDLVHPDDRTMVKAIVQQALADPQPYVYHYRVVRPDGTIRVVQSRGEVVVNERGEVVRLMGTAQDVTERWQAEEALRQSEARFRALFEYSPGAVLLLDPHHPTVSWPIADCNDEACRMNGYSREELIGQTIDILHPAAREPAERSAILERLRRERIVEGEIVHRRKDGSLFTIHTAASLVMVDGRELVLGMDRDVTERRRAEEQAMELQLQRERVQLLTEFFQSVSHDFRTPLAIINTKAYLASRVTGEEQRERHLETIMLQVAHLQKLLDDMLVMSRLDSGVQLDVRSVDLDTVLKMLELKFRPLIETKGLSWAMECSATLPTIAADMVYLGRALANLLENAIAYTKQGGRITVRVQCNGEQVTIDVCDTGIGIQASDLPYLFERLYRADKARSSETGGSGLGLAMSKKIVEAHGGVLEVESAPGQGSTFRVRLPVGQAKVENERTSHPPTPSP